MSLSVNVKSASDVPNVEKFSKSDPFAVIKFQEKKEKTKHINDELNPQWNESFNFPLTVALAQTDSLEVEIFDYERIGKNKLICKTTISLREVARAGQHESSFLMTAKDGSKTNCKINLLLVYQAPPGAGEGGGGQTGGGAAGETTVGGEGDEGDEDLGGEDEGGDAEEGEGDGTEGVGGGVSGGDAGTSGTPQSAAAKKAAKRKAKRRAARANLPNRPLDFQIRFHVLEARRLPGGNIKPVVKIQCGDQIKGSSVQKGTTSPIWDEMLVFGFNERPADFLDKVIEIKVLNSRRVLSDALIGSFRLDVGLVFDEPDHAIIHKWLLLTDPDDATSEAKGYLKISMQVLGPGDEPKRSVSKIDDENVDIEANLLRPSGVRLQSATFRVKIFQAEDLPQMDAEFLQKLGKLFNRAEQKELVDPYAVVNFAGHKGRTATVMEDMTPEWNEQINLGVRVPSMCERMRISLIDYDRFNRDDYIGTTFISMSEISAPGENGFLPTFGPCFLNIYGSPREFSNLPDKYEYLNKGKIEGVSYRGRVLVEVEVEVGNFPTTNKELIKQDDVKRLVPYLRRRTYKLYAAFLHATQIEPADSPVEFEISIGNYGNKLDKLVPDTSSTTQPSNPVYDGNKYYYLPWFDTKPCVVVESSWEDNSYRIGSLNIILRIKDVLGKGLKECSDIMAQEVYDQAELQAKVSEILGNVIIHLDQEFPHVPQVGITKLDINLRKIREAERRNLIGDAQLLRTKLETPEEVIQGLEDILQRLASLAVEPQISVPDVIIWMLSGGKRVACKRIPAHQLMYSTSAMQAGALCGCIQTIKLDPPAVEEEEDLEDAKGGAQLRLLLWLGLDGDSPRWCENISDGQIAVYAETYENQAWFIKSWGTTALIVPKFSDSRGKKKLPKEAFITPEGWDWAEDWFISPEISVAFEGDSGRKVFQEELFELHFRVPFTSFDKGTISWRDIRNAELEGVTKDTLEVTKGWKWTSSWEIDMNRAVGDGGWEYTMDAEAGAWSPSERTYHLCRRRRWVRSRERLTDPKKEAKKIKEKTKQATEGWEYARLPRMTYHATDHKLDMARRRRWHRKLVQKKAGKPPIFYFESEKKKKKKKSKKSDSDSSDDECTQAPRMYLTFPEEVSYKYQLRAYIYQARDLYASDDSGLSDPYVHVAFGRYSQRTHIVKQSVCPTWDETILIDDIFLFGNPENIAVYPPVVALEFFDKDQIGKDEYLGSCDVMPSVRLDIPKTKSPRLQWFEIERYGKYAGDLLAAFELLLIEEGVDLPFEPPKAPKGQYLLVPSGIKPILQKTRIEVLCWGVRDMKRFQLLPVTSPIVEIECGGTIKRTEPIKNTKDNPNFPEPVVKMDVNIPKERLYAPPLNIRILDKRAFGRKPAVGVKVIKTLKDFVVDPEAEAKAIAAATTVPHPPALAATSKGPTSLVGAPAEGVSDEKAAAPLGRPDEVAIHMEDEQLIEGADPDATKDSDFDWWSKYYTSVCDEQCQQQDYKDQKLDELVVYNNPLEDYFDNFEDIATTMVLYRGKGSREEGETEGQVIGKLKGAIKVCPFPPDNKEPPLMFGNIPPTSPVECVVRVYVVRAFTLQPKDPNGKSDPYIKLKLGKKKINDKERFIPNSLNPIFGRYYELPALLPIDHTLKITVMDYDRTSADDLIGETFIDLENRYLTQKRALCGLPQSFAIRGLNKWRDSLLPRDKLLDLCKMKNIDDPRWNGLSEVIFAGRSRTLAEFEPDGPPHPDVGPEDQRLALHLLREQGLVPEHVETRPLFNPMHPGIEQGRLQMWVDIFPKNLGAPPPPVDITPRQPTKYTLRIVIWNTKDVLLDEISVVTGESMSDIYVKGWIQGQDETQKTDVHYRSLDGEGNFNWRLVYPFEYIPQEKVIVVRKKEHFWSLDKTERRIPPRLTLQVWDNDLFNPDDFIGTLDINLDRIPEGARDADRCDLHQLDPSKADKAKDLFKAKRMRGWWPFYSDSDGIENRYLAGKVEMELEIVTEEEEQLRPAGQGREEPNMNPNLPEPNRPATSFLWFTSPWKTCKFIVWKYYKWHIIGGIVGVIVILLLVIFIYSAPNYIGQWLINSLLPGASP